MEITIVIIVLFVLFWLSFLLFRIFLTIKNSNIKLNNKLEKEKIKEKGIDFVEPYLNDSSLKENLIIHKNCYLGKDNINSHNFHYLIQYKNVIAWFEIKNSHISEEKDDSGSYTMLFYGNKKGNKLLTEVEAKTDYLEKKLGKIAGLKIINIMMLVNPENNNLADTRNADNDNTHIWTINTKTDLVRGIAWLDKEMTKLSKGKNKEEVCETATKTLSNLILELTKAEVEERKEHERTAIFNPEA